MSKNWTLVDICTAGPGLSAQTIRTFQVHKGADFTPNQSISLQLDNHTIIAFLAGTCERLPRL
jgi:hypothetical protein